MFRFLMSSKYFELFLMIPKCKKLTDLSKQSGMTLSHLSVVTDVWANQGIIKKERKGREADIKLTKKGDKLAVILKDYKNLSESKEEVKNEGEDKAVQST